MELNKLDVLLALEDKPKTQEQLTDQFSKSQNIESFIKELILENLVTNIESQNLYEITQRGKMMLDSDFCDVCDCSPCDCSWGSKR